MSRSWFWPMILTAVGLASLAAALTAVAIENPVPPSPLGEGTFAADDGLLARCLGLVNLFSTRGDPLDSSDAPLLIGAAVAAVASVLALRIAAGRR